MDRELERLEREIMDSVYVKRNDELIEYLKTMTDEEMEDLLNKPFPTFEDSFLVWSLRRRLGME